MIVEEENFSHFMEEALYGEDGFYTKGRGSGRTRDFLTSPEIGDLFGLVVAGYIDNWYEQLNSDQPAIVLEVGCGPGALASSIARAKMRNAQNIEYFLVDVSHVHLKTCEEKLSKLDTGFNWSLHETIPECGFPTLLLTNELLDNLVFNIGYADEIYKEFKPDEMQTALLGMETYAHWGVFKNIDNLKGADVPRDIGHFRIPQHVGIARFFEQLSIATSNVSSLSVLMFDYIKPVTELEDENWLRLYADNKRIIGVDNVLTALRSGTKGDITADVIKEDLHVLLDMEGFSKIRFEKQSQWLAENGIDILAQTPSKNSESAYEKIQNWMQNQSADSATQDFSIERDILIEEQGLGSFLVVQAKREI